MKFKNRGRNLRIQEVLYETEAFFFGLFDWNKDEIRKAVIGENDAIFTCLNVIHFPGVVDLASELLHALGCRDLVAATHGRMKRNPQASSLTHLANFQLSPPTL